MASLLLMAKPLSSGGKSLANSLSSVSSEPSSILEEFMRTDSKACVAQALLIIYKKTHTFGYNLPNCLRNLKVGTVSGPGWRRRSSGLVQ